MSSFSLPVSRARFALLNMSLFVFAATALMLPADSGAQQTFTGGGAISVSRTQTGSSSSTLTIASATGSSIASLKITLNGVTTDGTACADGNCWSMLLSSFMLQAPHGGPALVLLGNTGDGTDGDDAQDSGSGLSNVAITIQDGANFAPGGPASTAWPHTGSITVKPTSFYLADGQTPPQGSAADFPQSDGSATLLSRFGGTGISNGDQWTLTVINCCGLTTPITVTSWSMIVTYASTTPTSTVASSNLNPAFSASPNNSVTLKATVTPSSGPTGTVAFTDNGATIAGCGAVALSSGLATCTTAALAQGYHSIDTTYSGGGGYGQSSGSLTQLIEVHPSQSGNTWCNNTSFSAVLNGTPIAYPAMIPVSGYPAGSTVGNVTLELDGVTEPTELLAEFLLVAPGGANNLDFLDSAFHGAGSGTNLFISDSASTIPNYGSPVNNGTYLPWDGQTQSFDTFPASNSPIVDSSIPSVPGTINYPAIYGKTNAFTLQQAFSGAPANGDWALYATASNGSNALTVGGWCVTLDVNSGLGSTTSLSSSAQRAVHGSSVTLTATVTVQGSSAPINTGTVEFEDETTGAVLATANSLNGSGVATVTLSSLAEGDHKILASYSGTGTYNTSFATMYQRVDDSTGVITVSANQWQFCNTGQITLPMGTSGAESPNPSNIFVSNLPGNLKTATLTLNNFSISQGDQLDNTASLVVGPTGTALDFFSNTAGGTIEDTAALGNYTFADAASTLVPSGSGNLSPGSYKPTSYVGTDSANDVFTADPGGFYTLPGTFGYSAARGSSTFSTEFSNIDPNGAWSLYFNSPNANASGTGAANGWCVNLTENLPSVTPALNSADSFTQGQQGAQFTVDITNDGPGLTGDPVGTNPMTVTYTPDAAFSSPTGSGSGWSCSGTAPLSCTNDSTVGASSSYPTLTIGVNVSGSAPASVGAMVSVSGAGVASTSGSGTITVDASPVLAVSKAHTGTFTAGSTAQWTIMVLNTSANGGTSGVVTVSDALPADYTLAGYTSSGNLWSCGSSLNMVTCTAAPGISGGGNSTITLTVNVPATSPASVSNTAYAWGGGDVTHTSSGTAAASNTDTAQVQQPTPAVLTSPVSGSTFAGPSATFTWTAGVGASNYYLLIGTTGVGSKNLYNSAPKAGLSYTFNGLPLTGVPIYVRLFSVLNGTWVSNDYQFTAAGPAALTSPSVGSGLPGRSATFTWNAEPNASGYYLWIGTAGAGSNDLYNSELKTGLSYTFTGLPVDGSTVYVRLITSIGGYWVHNDYQFTAAGPATIIAPANSSVLPGPAATFTWTAEPSALGYYLWIGTGGTGSNDIYNSGLKSASTTSYTFTSLPAQGQTIYVRLITNFNGQWLSRDYTYTAATASVLTAPNPGSTFTGPSATFTWTAAPGATGYYLWIGSLGVGSNDIYNSQLKTGTSYTFGSLPTNGEVLYVRLFTSFNGITAYNDYQFTAQ
jgi:hypothetical protein